MKKNRAFKIFRGGLKGFSLGGGIGGVIVSILLLVTPITAPVSIAIIVGIGVVFAIAGMVRAYRSYRARHQHSVEMEVTESIEDDPQEAGYQMVPTVDLQMVETVKGLERKINHLQHDLEKQGIDLSDTDSVISEMDSDSAQEISQIVKASVKYSHVNKLGTGSFFHKKKRAPLVRSVSDSKVLYGDYQNDPQFMDNKTIALRVK